MNSQLTEKPPTSALASIPSIDFSDHESFHATVARATGGAAAGVLLTDLVARLAGSTLFESGFFIVAAVGGAMTAVAAAGRSWVRAATGGALGVLGGALFAGVFGVWPWFAAALLGFSIAPILAPGESLSRKAVTGLVAAILGAAGAFVGRVILGQELLEGLVPAPVGAALAGAASGLFLGLAAAPKHIARPRDPMEIAFGTAIAGSKDELKAILQRALAIHQAVRSDLEARGDDAVVAKLGARVRDSSMRILQIAEQCRRIESELGLVRVDELQERIAELEAKAESAKDARARATYQSAVETLRSQERSFAEAHAGSERVVARLHANVALLEKVRFSLIQLRNADAERWGTEVGPILEAVDELAREIEVTSSAVGEVFSVSDDLPQLSASAPTDGD